MSDAAVSDGAARWEAFARALTDEATVIADRDDLLVTVAPGAGHGAPACFLPATATIELDATHLGELDPDTATPDQDSDRVRYRIGWGLLVHECAHAQHSRWDLARRHPGRGRGRGDDPGGIPGRGRPPDPAPAGPAVAARDDPTVILAEITPDPAPTDPTDPTDPAPPEVSGEPPRRGRGRSRSRPRVWCWPASMPGS